MEKDLISRVPRVEAKTGYVNITIRLSGDWLLHWNKIRATDPKVSPTDLMKEFLSLGFHAVARDDSGMPVEILLRAKSQNGQQLPDQDLLEVAKTRILLKVRESRKKK